MSVHGRLRWAAFVASLVALTQGNGSAARSTEGREFAIHRVTTIRAGLLSQQPGPDQHQPTRVAQNWYNWANYGGYIPRLMRSWQWPAR